MSNEPKDPKAKDRAAPDRSPSAASAGAPERPQQDSASQPPEGKESKRSGRVAFDARGNSVWEWQLETGVYSRDVSTQKLKKLDLGDLSIAETATHKRPPGLEEEPRPGGGFNPYDNSPVRPRQDSSNPYDKARAIAKQPAQPAPPPQKPRATPRSPDELRKLSEWIKLKKRLEDDKDK